VILLALLSVVVDKLFDAGLDDAISTFDRPCAHHSTIRARVATDPGTSEL